MSANRVVATGGSVYAEGGNASMAPGIGAREGGDMNGHQQNRENSNAHGHANRYTNGIGRNGRRKRDDVGNGAQQHAPTHANSNGADDSENFDDINSMLLLMSPGVNNVAKRRHCEPTPDAPSPSGVSDEEREGTSSLRTVASPAEEDDNDARTTHTTAEEGEEEGSHRGVAVTSLLFEAEEEVECRAAVSGYALDAPRGEGAKDSLPWSHIHHLLEHTAVKYGNNVAYIIRRADTANDTAGQNVDDTKDDDDVDGENLIGNFERFILGASALDEGGDSDEEAEEGQASVDLERVRGDDEVAESSPQSNSDGGSSGRSSDPASMATSSTLEYEESRAVATRGGEVRASPRRVPHEGDYGLSQRMHVNVTYRKVQERVSKIAGALQALGVKKADRVGIMLPNCPEYFELYFAISAASAISVQLNPRLAAPELRGVLHDSQCRYIFTASEPELLSLLTDVGLVENTFVRGLIWVNSIGGWVAPDVDGAVGDALEGSDDGLAGMSTGRGWLNRNGIFEGVTQLSYDEIAAFSMEHWEAGDASQVGAASSSTDEHTHDEGSVATLFYTSGTTGVPKGVMLTHANVLYHSLRTRETLGWMHPSGSGIRRAEEPAPSIVWGHFAPMFHVGDAWAVFATTEIGGRHVFIPRFEINNILKLIQIESVEYTKIVPTMLHLIAHSPQLRSVDASSLKMIISGGAPLHVDVVARAMRSLDCDLLQDYGMTECCCHITLGDPAEEAMLPQDEKLRRKVKAGKVFRGMQIRVVDPEWEAVDGADPPSLGVDEVGELWVRGDNLFIGYWRRPEETTKVMHRGWFRTGDLGSIDADGYVSVSDRKKDMIISGGENIFSIEVETVLRDHPSVSAAAVYGVPHALLGELVQAAVTLNASAVSTAETDRVLVEELRALCEKSLAPYKVPRVIKVVPDFPRGPTGKIQKHILRNKARGKR